MTSSELNNLKTILVTGGCGFIGTALIRRLLIETDAQIINIDKNGEIIIHRRT